MSVELSVVRELVLWFRQHPLLFWYAWSWEDNARSDCDRLTLRTTSRDDVGVAYLFCNYERRADQGVADLLAALLERLVRNRSDLAALGTSSYYQYLKQRGEPSPDDNIGLLRIVCSNITRVYIVVDALDEFHAEDNARGRLIDTLRELQSTTDVRFMFTSRLVPQIVRNCSGHLNLEVRASEEDVRRLVADQISRLPSCIHLDEHLKNDVATEIAGATDGMFSLARFHVDSLLGMSTEAEVRSKLCQLSQVPAPVLERIYRKASNQIDDQLPRDRLLAKRALSWISNAMRPLTTKELCCALAIQPDITILGHEDTAISDIDHIVNICAGLAKIEKDSNTVQLVHYTAQRQCGLARHLLKPAQTADTRTPESKQQLSTEALGLRYRASSGP